MTINYFSKQEIILDTTVGFNFPIALNTRKSTTLANKHATMIYLNQIIRFSNIKSIMIVTTSFNQSNNYEFH